jgi:hypothetical protein
MGINIVAVSKVRLARSAAEKKQAEEAEEEAVDIPAPSAAAPANTKGKAASEANDGVKRVREEPEKSPEDEVTDDEPFEETPQSLYTVHCMQYSGWSRWKKWLFALKKATDASFEEDTEFNALKCMFGAAAIDVAPISVALVRTLAMSYDNGPIYAEDAELIAAEMTKNLPLAAAATGVPCPTEEQLHYRHMNMVLHPAHWHTESQNNVKRANYDGIEKFEAEWAPGTEIIEAHWRLAFYIDMLQSLRHASDGGAVTFS